MADQITKSVRRIVRGMKDDPTGLGLADDYKGIGTSRGEAFINARGDVTGSGSNGSGSDKDEQPPSSTPDTGTPDDNDTGGGGGVNKGSSPTNALDGDVDAVVPAIETDTQTGTVTGTDPATGDPVSLNVNTLEGIEYTPPDGWDDPDLPPTFTDGKYWHMGTDVGPSGFGLTEETSADDFASNVATTYNFDNGNTTNNWFFSFFRNATPPGEFFSGTYLDGSSAAPGFYHIGGYAQVDSGQFDCPGPGGVCDTEVDRTWPVDGNCSVVWDHSEGGYKGNANDPDCSAAQLVASPSIIIRSVDDSNKYYKFTKLNDGRTKISEVDSGGVIVTDSVIKVVGEDGRYDNVYPADLDGSII